MEYRENDYFNERDTYLFESSTLTFESKVEFDKGYWWTVESLHYKCTSLPCKKL